ncbi:MAG TPA: response regulator [Williamwhitmania sp.]|nr:response regulator [Williamwhitmania sp.]
MDFRSEYPIEGSYEGKSFLIAEDEEINYLFLEELLKPTGAILYWAANGAEALQLLEDHPEIELILMDIKMPVMNGYEATQIIRKKDLKVKIIATTAYAFVEDREKVLNAGCDGYISKPINIQLLMSEIRKLLR